MSLLRGAAPSEASRTLSGIAITLAGVFIFAGTNAMAKHLGNTYPVSEVLFARSLVAMVLLLPFIGRADLAVLRASGRPGLHIARAVLSAVEVGFFYWAITDLPLAMGTAIYLASPIYVVGLAAVFLREQVRWRRWLAVLCGFAGVLVALQPAEVSLSPHAMVAVAGSLMYAISLVITRRLRGVPTTLLVASQVLPLLLGAGAMAAFGWVMPGLFDAALLVLVGVMSMVAYLCINRGLQLAPASMVTPFNYVSIVWAVILGYIVFAEIPTRATLAGAAIIVAAGLFIVLRERTLGVSRPPPVG